MYCEWDTHQLEDVATVALEFSSGVHACLHMGYLLPGVGPRNDTYFGLRGMLGAATWQPTSEGEFTVTSTAPGWQTAPMRQISMKLVERPFYASQWGYDFVAAFIRAIREGNQTPVSIHGAYRVMRIIDACHGCAF